MIVSIYSHDAALFVGALVQLFLVDVLQYRKEVVICRLCILLRRLGLDHASDAVRVEEFDEEAIFILSSFILQSMLLNLSYL